MPVMPAVSWCEAPCTAASLDATARAPATTAPILGLALRLPPHLVSGQHVRLHVRVGAPLPLGVTLPGRPLAAAGRGSVPRLDASPSARSSNRFGGLGVTLNPKPATRNQRRGAPCAAHDPPPQAGLMRPCPGQPQPKPNARHRCERT